LKINHFGDLEIHNHIFLENDDWKNLLSDVNHHMGGTKMSDSKEFGVVDNELKVWGVNNLFVCSSSVFPTSSHSNPTLTTLALASRLINNKLLN
jgi:choline dehydrogenase-like flavoprotein